MENNEMPLITVIMPTYNTPIDFLSQAVNSILQQTYSNIEFIIIDDCSNDGGETIKYLKSINDRRILIVQNSFNIGITASLNKGLELATGKYIARMDSDDISLPNRLAIQFNYMESHPNVIVLGTGIKAFGDSSYDLIRTIPEREYYRCSLLFGNTFAISHPTALFRASLILKNEIKYDSSLPTAQDYDMWNQCCNYGELFIIPEVLLYYRVHKLQISNAKRQLQKDCTKKIQGKILKNIYSDIDDSVIEKHYIICTQKKITYDSLKWFKSLRTFNCCKGYYLDSAFTKCIDDFVLKKIKDNVTTTNSFLEIIYLFFILDFLKKLVLIKFLFTRCTTFMIRKIKIITRGEI